MELMRNVAHGTYRVRFEWPTRYKTNDCSNGVKVYNLSGQWLGYVGRMNSIASNDVIVGKTTASTLS
jgi:hypothetical protein